MLVLQPTAAGQLTELPPSGDDDQLLHARAQPGTPETSHVKVTPASTTQVASGWEVPASDGLVDVDDVLHAVTVTNTKNHLSIGTLLRDAASGAVYSPVSPSRTSRVSSRALRFSGALNSLDLRPLPKSLFRARAPLPDPSRFPLVGARGLAIALACVMRCGIFGLLLIVGCANSGAVPTRLAMTPVRGESPHAIVAESLSAPPLDTTTSGTIPTSLLPPDFTPQVVVDDSPPEALLLEGIGRSEMPGGSIAASFASPHVARAEALILYEPYTVVRPEPLITYPPYDPNPAFHSGGAGHFGGGPNHGSGHGAHCGHGGR